jgi:tryptophan-rich sensory protein
MASTTKALSNSLAANLLGPLGLVLVINAAIFGLGWDTATQSSSEGLFLAEIPGWAIGVIWTGLFVAMGWAMWRVSQSQLATATTARTWLITLIVACAIYPFYTAGLSNPTVGFIGNVATLILAVIAFVKVRLIDKIGAFGPALVIAWLTFAVFYSADQQRLFW